MHLIHKQHQRQKHPNHNPCMKRACRQYFGDFNHTAIQVVVLLRKNLFVQNCFDTIKNKVHNLHASPLFIIFKSCKMYHMIFFLL